MRASHAAPFLLGVVGLVLATLACGGGESPAHPPSESGKVAYRVTFLGDTDFGESYQEGYAAGGAENVLKARGYDYPLQGVKPILEASDLVIANLETPLTSIPKSPLAGSGKSPLHWSDPEKAPAYLNKYGVDVVSLANNHALDYGPEGLRQTLGALQANGIEWFGAGPDLEAASAPYMKEIAVGTGVFHLAVIGAFEYRRNYDADFAFYAGPDKPGVNVISVPAIAAQIRKLKAATPDVFVVVFPHWGDNYAWATGDQVGSGRQLVDAGADLIVGTGAHMIQEVERYRGVWDVYSIGNLMFNSRSQYQTTPGSVPYSFVAELCLSDSPDGLRKSLRLYPIFTDNLVTNYQSRLVTDAEFERVHAALLLHAFSAGLERQLRTGRDEIGRYIELAID